jgi:hypothetical protein
VNRDRPAPPWARRSVELAVRALPDGPRQRYRQEFLAELHGMSRSGRFRHVCGLLTQARALRAEIRATEVRLERLHSSTHLVRLLLCATGLRHRWDRQFTEDGTLYGRCSRCGEDEGPYDTFDRATRRNRGAR